MKLHDFSYDVMKMKRELAAIDYNHHLRRRLKLRGGEPAYTHEYHKSTKTYPPRFWKVATLSMRPLL